MLAQCDPTLVTPVDQGGDTDGNSGLAKLRKAQTVNDNFQMRHKHFAFRRWHLALVIFLVLAVLTGLYVAIQQSSVERRLKALRAAGYPTNFAELAEYNRLPAGTLNAADVYGRAFWQYRPPVDEETWKIPIVGSAALPGRGLPVPQTMTDAISQYLARNRTCLTLLHEAGAIEHCRYTWDYTKGLTELPAIRRCAWLLELSATYHAYSGDPNGAAECIQDGLRLADSLRNEPGLVCYLIRRGCSALAVRGLERSMNATAFTDAQLREMDLALAATAATTLDLAQVMITERCFMLESCRDTSLKSSWPLTPSRGVGPRLLVHLPGIRRIGVVDTLDYMEDCIAAAKLPPQERMARFRALEQEAKDLSFMHLMVNSILSSTGELGALHARFPAIFDLARTALAVERYRLAAGRLPEALGQLVPQYLDHVPIDPFDGQPIRYRRTEPGYVVYNVAEDGQDNGGREWDEVPQGQLYDLCFVVTR